MINAYVVGISTHYEGEDIEVRYSIFEDQKQLCKRSVMQRYQKPLVVSHVALLTLLKELKKYKGKEIVIIINDASLDEQIRGLSKTKKPDVLLMAKKVERELSKFGNSVRIKDVSNDHVQLREWDDVLRF